MSIKNSKTKNLLIKQINELTASEQTTLYEFLEKDFGLLRQQADDVRVIFKEYLRALTEDDLILIFREYLRIHSIIATTTTTSHGRGEHGADIIAWKKVKEKDNLYAYQLKSGDITLSLWRGSGNKPGIRGELHAMVDTAIEIATRQGFKLKDRSRIKTFFIVSGQLQGDVAEEYERFSHEVQDRQEVIICLWNLNKLVDEFSQDLLNSSILFNPYLRELLIRILASIDKDESKVRIDLFQEFMELVFDSRNLRSRQNRVNRKNIEKILYAMTLVFHIIHITARQRDNLNPANELIALGCLVSWDHLRRQQIFEKKSVKDSAIRGFDALHEIYLNFLKHYIEKLHSRICLEDGLFCGKGDEIYYPIRFFEVLGRISYYCYCSDLLDEEGIDPIDDVLIPLIENNRHARSRPQFDNHVTPITAAIIVLTKHGRADFAKKWLEEMMELLNVRKNKLRELPIYMNNIEELIKWKFEGIYDEERNLGQSYLLYILLELTIVYGFDDLYGRFRIPFEENISLQDYYPGSPEETEDEIYRAELKRIGTLVTVNQRPSSDQGPPGLPEEPDHLRIKLMARNQKMGGNEFSALRFGRSHVLLLASIYHKSPIMPFLWRNGISTRGDLEDT